MTLSVFVIADSPAQQRAVCKIYDTAGFRTYSHFENQNPIAALSNAKPDVVVMATENGIGNALSICQQVRSQINVPVIVSPQFHDEVEEMSCLSAGADDYVSRDRNQRILVTRTTAVIGREKARLNPSKTVLVHKELKLSVENRVAMVGEKILELTRTEFELLAILMHNKHRVIHRQELLDRVWGTWFGDDHLLEVHISRLRRKIELHGGPRIAVAVRGVGYRLDASQIII
jgi:DNA-binding response OmpR family regulator